MKAQVTYRSSVTGGHSFRGSVAGASGLGPPPESPPEPDETGTALRRLGRLANRKAGRNPWVAVATRVARNPRGAFLLFGSLGAVAAIGLLLALSSLQAFLVISQQSNANRQSQLPLGVNQAGGSDQATGTALAGGTGDAAGQQPTEPVTIEETERVHGISVHHSIAANVQAMIDHAAADGITLSGWGWRDPAAQIRLRREHCGTSDYAVYEMPSSQCSPPTARPGRSQHERGLAIDFTYNGRSISNHSNAGFRWLQANAAAYGFKNLPSEPWHWSTTGR